MLNIRELLTIHNSSETFLSEASPVNWIQQRFFRLFSNKTISKSGGKPEEICFNLFTRCEPAPAGRQ